jgi:hypothetical protein
VTVIDGVQPVADTIVERPERDPRSAHLRTSSANGQK